MVNAFWLDRDLETAATWLVDAHVTSSVFECSMVLTTAAQLRGYPEDDDLYVTHRGHPLVQWAAQSHPNWQRLRAYTEAAHEEWRYRWDHSPDERHASWETVETLDLDRVSRLEWPSDALSDPPQLTGEWEARDYVDGYRYYYANDKRDLFAWAKDREPPPWIEAYTVASGEDADARIPRSEEWEGSEGSGVSGRSEEIERSDGSERSEE